MDRRLSTRCAAPVTAAVEWRSERRWADRPVALVIGGARVEVEVEERWVEGPAAAGGETRRGFVVVDGAGQTYRVRHGSRGGLTVERLAAPGRDPR